MSERLGIPLKVQGEPIKRTPGAPGFGWTLSDEARRDIAEIERHIIRPFPLWSRKP